MRRVVEASLAALAFAALFAAGLVIAVLWTMR